MVESIISTSEREMGRLLKISNLDLDYNRLDAKLKHLVKLAAQVAGCRMSQINIIDSNMQWTISSFNLNIKQMAKETSVCQHTILEDHYLEIPNLVTDYRFYGNADLYRSLNIIYYLGVPIVTSDGYHIGAICVLDNVTKRVDEETIGSLKTIAQEIADRLDSNVREKTSNTKLYDAQHEKQKITHDLRGPITGIASLTSLILKKPDRYNTEQLLGLIEMINRNSFSMLERFESFFEATGYSEVEVDDFQTTPLFLKETLEKLYHDLAVDKGVFFRVNLTNDNTDFTFRKEGLSQILGNIITYCIASSPVLGNIEVSISSEFRNNSKILRFDIQDKGEGLNAEQLNEALSYFDNVSKKDYGHDFPFAIAIAKYLTSQKNGVLKISSRRNTGNFFHLEFFEDLL